uniref:Uncharacterized protein n=1 Tax=Siphoviridae sp. ctBLh2 TaxID=2827803 RepID=A0A8S5S4D9_9CAUD|nr:MAG TPA: hypothetical protein [Siphoviridae sp. ctBLh2]
MFRPIVRKDTKLFTMCNVGPRFFHVPAVPRPRPDRPAAASDKEINLAVPHRNAIFAVCT